MPKFAVKMSWLDTYVQVIEAPTEAEAIQEAHDVGDWGDPKWGGDEQDTWAEQIEETETNDPNGLPLNFTDKYHEEEPA
jgi:hypothetical protein